MLIGLVAKANEVPVEISPGDVPETQTVECQRVAAAAASP
jgi:hypothetical protein